MHIYESDSFRMLVYLFIADKTETEIAIGSQQELARADGRNDDDKAFLTLEFLNRTDCHPVVLSALSGFQSKLIHLKFILNS